MNVPLELVPGDVLDERYEVLERMKSGTMGFVVRARDGETGEDVACKVPLDTSAYKADALMAQYKRLRRLHSLHLPAVLGFVRHRSSTPTFPFIVMELVSGLELEEWYVGKPLRRRLEIIADVSTTLGLLGGTHGDLFMRNVLVTDEDRVVLIDPDADEFGSSRPQSATSGALQDIAGLRAIVDECISEAERLGLGTMMRRLRSSEPEALSPSEIAAMFRHLLSLPFLPGESSASLAELAVSYKKRQADNRSTYRQVYQYRDLAFRNAADLLRRLARPFGLRVPDPEESQVPVSDEETLRRESASLSSSKGTLHHRTLIVTSDAGDQIWFAFNGQNGFRLPWPYGDNPGLLDKGVLNVQRDNQAILFHDLEVHDAGGHPTISVIEPNRVRSLDDPTVDRVLRVLLEVILPGLPKPFVTPNGKATNPALPIIGWEFLAPSLERLGLATPDTFLGWLKAATETALRLPRHTHADNGIWGSTLGQFFDKPPNYDSRLRLVREVASRFVQDAGHFFQVLYRFDVRVIDEIDQRLRVDVDGQVHGDEFIDWTFEFSLAQSG